MTPAVSPRRPNRCCFPRPAPEPRPSSGLIPLLFGRRRLRFPSPSPLFLLDRRGDGGVHERVRVLAMILALDDKVQPKRAGLHQRHARSHQQNLLRARERHHRAQESRLLERTLHRQRHAAFRLGIGQRPSPLSHARMARRAPRSSSTGAASRPKSRRTASFMKSSTRK